MPEWFYLAFVIITQLAGTVYWGSNISTRVKQLEKEQDRLEQEVNGIAKLDVRLSVVETILQAQTAVLEQIRDSLLKRSI